MDPSPVDKTPAPEPTTPPPPTLVFSMAHPSTVTGAPCTRRPVPVPEATRRPWRVTFSPFVTRIACSAGALITTSAALGDVTFEVPITATSWLIVRFSVYVPGATRMAAPGVALVRASVIVVYG